MIVHKNCRDCQFRAGEHEPYECAYALLTGLTRKARPPGDGCPYKVVGDRKEGVKAMVIDPDQKGDSVEKVRSKPVTTKVKYVQKHTGREPVPEAKYQEMYDKGLPDREAGEALGVTHHAVYLWRRKHNLPANRTDKSPGKVTEQEYQACYDRGLTDIESAKEMHVSASAVAYFRKKRHLPSHTESQRGEKKVKMEKKTPEEQKPAEVKKETVERLMKLPVLAEILKNISGTFPDAQISGEAKTCQRVRFIGEYSAEGALESARIELLPA